MDSSDDEFFENLMELDAATIQLSADLWESFSTTLPSTSNLDFDFKDEVNPGRPNYNFHDRNMLKFCQTKTPAMFYRLFR